MDGDVKSRRAVSFQAVWGEKDKVRIRLGQGTGKVREAWGKLGTYPGTYLVPAPVPRAWQRKQVGDLE